MATRADIPELLPCPHCDGAAVIKSGNVKLNGRLTRIAYAECKQCGARTRIYKRVMYRDYVERAAVAWNCRADDLYEVVDDGEE